MAKTLRLRGAARYSILGIRREPFERGDTVTVEDAIAEKLLKETVRDKANNRWNVWEEVAASDGPARVDPSVKDKTPAPKQRRRRRTKKEMEAARAEAASE